jgi:hypothetical protein
MFFFPIEANIYSPGIEHVKFWVWSFLHARLNTHIDR